MFMKRIVFLLAWAASMTAAYAQWQKPVPEAAVFEAGREFYLYNVDASAFFLGNNDWGTQASWKTTQGFKVKFIADEVEGEGWDGVSYVWTNLIEANDYGDHPNMVGEWGRVFVQDDGIWVDQASTSTSDHLWTLEKQDDGTFLIGLSPRNTTFKPSKFIDTYIGAIGVKNDTRLYLCEPDGMTEEEAATAMTHWIFVEPSVYESMHDELVLYWAAAYLGAAIEKAENECPDINLDAEKAVYNNTDNSAETLNAATKDVETKVLAYWVEHASPQQSVDLTNLIVNHDFSNETNKGWSGSAPGYWNGSIQFFTYPDIDMRQVVNLPYAGIYRLNVQGFYREGTYLDVHRLYKDQEGVLPGRGEVYAVVGTETMFRTMTSIAADPSLSSLNSGVDEVELKEENGSVWYPNMMSTGLIYLASGHYNDNSFYVVVPEAGTNITIGYRKPGTVPTDWTFMDNWSLAYIGGSSESYTYMRDQTLLVNPDYATAAAKMLHTQALYDEYIAARTSLAAATDPDIIKKGVIELPTKARMIRENFCAYIDYKNAYDEAFTMISAGSYAGKEVDALSDYLMGEGRDIIDDCLLTTDEIKSATEKLRTMMSDVQENGMKSGADVTDVLINPNFDSSAGWVNTNTNISTGLMEFPCAEAFETAFEIYQDVTGLPNGIYQFNAYAYYRPGPNGSYDGSEEVKAQLFFNTTEKNVKHIMADASPEAAYVVDSWMTDYDTGNGWVPNSAPGASTAFMAGRYNQTLYGIVTDGTLHIGIRSRATSGSARWAAWGHFQLIYHAYDFTDEIVESLNADIIQPAEALLEYKMGAAEYEALSGMIETAKSASDPHKRFDALCSLSETMTQAKRSIDNYTRLTNECQELNAALTLYRNTAFAEAIVEATTLAETIEEGIIEGRYSNSDIEEQSALIADAMNKLRIPKDYATASIDNPIDMTQVISNPDYAANNNSGWAGTPPSAVNYNTGELFWVNYDYNQTLRYLPAGNYIVGVQAFYRAGMPQDDYDAFIATPEESNHGILYAKANGEEVTQPLLRAATAASVMNVGGTGDWRLTNELYVPNMLDAASNWFRAGYYQNEMPVKVGEDGVLTIGIRKQTVIDWDWTCWTNWTLTYLGTEDVTAIDDITDDRQQKDLGNISIYNLSGQRLSRPQRGINIVGGKKILVR